MQKNKNKKRGLVRTPANAGASLQRRRGFTLIEMMVSVSIFVIVAMIASGTFVIVAQAQKKAQSVKIVVDNLNFALDGMVIPMRMGSDYAVDCNGDSVTFKDINDNTISYIIKQNSLYKKSGAIDNPGQCSSEGHGVPVVSKEIDIDEGRSSFEAVGGNVDAVRIKLVGVAEAGENDSEFNVQTFVSQRNY